MARFEVITGPARRRRWSEDQKRAIVAESFAPGAVISDVARADVSSGQIYRWRQELRGMAGFAQVLIAPAESAATNGEPSCAEPAIEVEVGKVRVRIPGTIPAALAAAVVKALARR
jgi:transposase